MKEQAARKSLRLSNRSSGNASIATQADRSPAQQEAKETPIARQSDPITLVEAKIDVGLGNAVFIRGQGDGLSWDAGQPLTCRDASTWVWSSKQAKDSLTFKLLLNDQIWAHGEDVVVQAGSRIELAPRF